MAEFRILSLDGGGSWALIQVKTLIDLYSKTGDGSDISGHELLRKFDLIVANSAGALVLGGLIKNLSLKETLDYFIDAEKRERLFVEYSLWQKLQISFLHVIGIGPNYITEAKFSGLETILGDAGAQLVTKVPAAIGAGDRGQLPHILICAFDYDVKRGVFFRSDEKSLAASFGPNVDITVSQAIHASTNAPVSFFAAPAAGPGGRQYWDGAVGGYNNPVLAGVIEVIANLERYQTNRESIKVLSLGTGSIVLPRARPGIDDEPCLVVPPGEWSVLEDLDKLATSILDDPPDAATFHSHVLLGCPLPSPRTALPAKSRIVRFNPLVQPVRSDPNARWDFPPRMSRDDFCAIKDIDMVTMKQGDIDRIADFCNRWLRNEIPNQPIRANGATLEPEIGPDRYAAAKEAWKELFSN
ncbi:MAG TPA: patatin-like phospholipase family protein [Rhizomicrobium sp.]|jgi:hypothetical protein